MGVYKQASEVCGLMRNVVAALRRMRGPRRGYFPVAVGAENGETKRFMVQTRALRDADFLELLSRSAEEYGFRNQGIIRIRCETKVFEERIGCSLTEDVMHVVTSRPTDRSSIHLSRAGF